MTAAQHITYNLPGLFTIDSFNDTTGNVKVVTNFQLKRAVDDQQVFLGAAVFEFLILNDQDVADLGRFWPYRYTSRYNFDWPLLLLGNVTVDGCSMEPVDDTTTAGATTTTTGATAATATTTTTTTTTATTNKDVSTIIVTCFPNPNDPNDPWRWCFWLWFVIICLVITTLMGASAMLLF